MTIEPIKTFRLTLRGFKKDDAMWAYSIWNDPQMGKYLPDEAKDEIDYDYVKELETLGDDDECCYMIPVLKKNEERVGTCSMMFSEDKTECDIAYCVHENYQGNGYATEIALGMIGYAREQGAEKVTIRVNEENGPSNSVAQKCGGRIVGEKTYRKQGTDMMMKELLYEVKLK
jgi:RimJ/RimL family protein N-acetyltransferase